MRGLHAATRQSLWIPPPSGWIWLTIPQTVLSHPTGPLQGFLRCEDGVARVSRVSTRRDPAPPAGFRGSRFGSARFRWKWTEVAFFPQSRRGPALRLSSARFMERRSPELVLGDLKARTYLGRGLLSVVSKFRPF